MKETEKGTNKWKNILNSFRSRIGRINIVKVPVLPKTYTDSTQPLLKILMAFPQ